MTDTPNNDTATTEHPAGHADATDGIARAVEGIPPKAVDGPALRWSDREWPRPWMGKFLDSLAMSPVIASAARAAGIARPYSYEAAAKWPVFAEAWAQAFQQGVDLVEQHVHRWATVGIEKVETRVKTVDGRVVEEVTTTSKEANAGLAMFVLRKHRPEYREQMGVEHSGPGGGPVRVEVDRMPTSERMLELLRIARELELPDAAAVIEGTASVALPPSDTASD